MTSARRIVICSLVVILFAIARDIPGNGSVQATNPQLVTVTNTPLPIQGSVSVGNTPTVTIANPSIPITGNVGITNTVSVAPQGTPTSDFCEPQPGFQTCNMKAVPSGMRLVIQEVDMNVVAQPGEGVYNAALTVTTNGSSLVHSFVLVPQNPDFTGNPTWAVHQQTTLYVDSQAQPTCEVVDTVLDSNPFVRCTYSGYLIPTQ